MLINFWSLRSLVLILRWNNVAGLKLLISVGYSAWGHGNRSPRANSIWRTVTDERVRRCIWVSLRHIGEEEVVAHDGIPIKEIVSLHWGRRLSLSIRANALVEGNDDESRKWVQKIRAD